MIPDTTKPIMGETICGCCGENYEDGEIFVSPWWDMNNDTEMSKYCILEGVEDWVKGSHGETTKNSDILDSEFWLEEYGKTQIKEILVCLHDELADWHIENAGCGRGCYGDPNGEWNNGSIVKPK